MRNNKAMTRIFDLNILTCKTPSYTNKVDANGRGRGREMILVFIKKIYFKHRALKIFFLRFQNLRFEF